MDKVITVNFDVEEGISVNHSFFPDELERPRICVHTDSVSIILKDEEQTNIQAVHKVGGLMIGYLKSLEDKIKTEVDNYCYDPANE